MSRVPTLKQVRQAALQGRTDEAISLLRVYGDRGDASASASLAELLAFQNEWSECLLRAGEFIANPRSVYAGNVFDDMIRLLGRAGQETKQWELILQVTQVAAERVEANIAGDAPSKQEAERTRYSKIFQALQEYAQREGSPPHELIEVFGVSRPTQAEQDIAYQKATQSTEVPPRLRSDPTALLRHRFSLARVYKQEIEVVRLYEEEQMPSDFDFAVVVAKAYLHREQPDLAWDVLWKHLPLWWPVDRAQVAPVILLVDTDLAGMMNRERCERVLTLPRGPEVQNAA